MKDNKIYWTMRNGKSISIDDMDINHLRNTLKMIIRNNSNYHKKLKEISPEKSFKELKIHGDIANFFIEEQNCSSQNEHFDMEMGINI